MRWLKLRFIIFCIINLIINKTFFENTFFFQKIGRRVPECTGLSFYKPTNTRKAKCEMSYFNLLFSYHIKDQILQIMGKKWEIFPYRSFLFKMPQFVWKLLSTVHKRKQIWNNSFSFLLFFLNLRISLKKKKRGKTDHAKLLYSFQCKQQFKNIYINYLKNYF